MLTQGGGGWNLPSDGFLLSTHPCTQAFFKVWAARPPLWDCCWATFRGLSAAPALCTCYGSVCAELRPPPGVMQTGARGGGAAAGRLMVHSPRWAHTLLVAAGLRSMLARPMWPYRPCPSPGPAAPPTAGGRRAARHCLPCMWACSPLFACRRVVLGVAGRPLIGSFRTR